MDVREIVRSVEKRDGSLAGGETLVVAAHVAQMQQWIVRQGLNFYPLQDDSKGNRKKKIDEVLKSNLMDLYYDPIVSTFLCSGSVLWYLRPTGSEGYEIHWYRGGEAEDPECQYWAYYKSGGRDLAQVVVRYSYEEEEGNPYGVITGTGSNIRWVRLTITADHIIDERSYDQPSLRPGGSQAGISGYGTGAYQRSVQVNSLKFIPCAISPNYATYPGDRGKSEFGWLARAIENENDMRSAMVENVFCFSSPTLVTSRPKQQVVEALDGFDGTVNSRPSWSSQNGYGTNSSPATRKSSVWVRDGRYNWPGASALSGGRSGGRVAKIIGNVLPEERFGYIFPDPINGDQWRFAQEYREGIHESLGGIDPLGQRAGMTFGEVKSLFGKVAATANKKCRSLWTHGLARLLEMVVFIEEEVFMASYREYLVTASPHAKSFQLQLSKGIPIDDGQILQDYVEGGFVKPPGVSGLAPYGDRSILWRWSGPVFEKTSEDRQKDSIVVRNQQELGVGSLQALQELFPEKEPREIEGMLTGVPFRFISSVSGSLGTLLQLQQQLSSIEDPQNPGYPLSIRIDLTTVIQEQIKSLEREISYGSRFDSANSISDAVPSISPGLSNASSVNASAASANAGNSGWANAASPSGVFLPGQLGLPATNTAPAIGGLAFQRSAVSPGGTPASVHPAGAGNPGWSGGFGDRQGSDSGASEWQKPIPSGGTVLRPSSVYPSSSAYGNPSVPGIPPDLPPSMVRDFWNAANAESVPPVNGNPRRDSGGSGRAARRRKK